MAEIDNVLFVRGFQNEESADSDEMDITDTDKGIIVNTFNDMIKISHEDIAKNLAASTSSNARTEKVEQEKSEESQDEESHDFDIVDIPVWEIGCDCRVTFKEDKVDYEATIIDIYHDYTCLVEFIGYGNQQIEDLDKLLPSWGLEAQKKQIQESESYYANLENKDPTNNGKNRQNRANRTRNNKIDSELFGPGLLPPQPPLPPMLANGGPSDDPEQNEALSAMLMSWYMSGYYTGLYHGQLKGKKM